jgi:hypothetical protein
MPYLVKLRRKSKAALIQVSRKKSLGKSSQLTASCQTILISAYCLSSSTADANACCSRMRIRNPEAEPHTSNAGEEFGLASALLIPQ